MSPAGQKKLTVRISNLVSTIGHGQPYVMRNRSTQRVVQGDDERGEVLRFVTLTDVQQRTSIMR